jgi:hypothetical protein
VGKREEKSCFCFSGLWRPFGEAYPQRAFCLFGKPGKHFSKASEGMKGRMTWEKRFTVGERPIKLSLHKVSTFPDLTKV